MAKPKKLKVYRTPIGFHDAYVAALSQKAALEAWGSTRNLFAQGNAEIVTDNELSSKPLANPGTVIKRSRGTTAQQIAALPSSKPQPNAKPVAKDEAARMPPTKRAAKPKPRPSRDAVDAAEGALARLQNQHAKADRELAAEQAALDRRREEMESAQRAEIATIKRALDRVEGRYSTAIRQWRG